MQRAVLVAFVLVLAGCQAPGAPAPTSPQAVTAESDVAREAAGGGEGGGPGTTQSDPDTDRLGWEDGYWYNESVPVTGEDGLDETELEALVARAMARVEHLRRLEFERQVPVSVINRSTFDTGASGNHSVALQRFDNAKFEALFLVGEHDDSIETQETTRSASVLGYYSSSREAIVIVSDSPTPRLTSERTLSHELVHALQDQHFGLENSTVRTRDAYQGRNGLLEGDAKFVEQRYQARCGNEWRCLSVETNGSGVDGSGGGGHFGIQFMMYFPYSDGPGFVEALRQNGGWAAVDDAYGDLPDGSPEVIYPDRYSEWNATNVTLRDHSSAEWDHVRPPGRPDYAVLGQSAIVASLAYTLVDEYNDTSVVMPVDVINYRSDGSLDQRDPFNYDVSAAAGWTGGRMHVYRNGDESAYVWKTRWEDEREAREFATVWTTMIRHWGGELVADGEWVIRDGEFGDAFAVQLEGRTVTVVNAPERTDLSNVHDA